MKPQAIPTWTIVVVVVRLGRRFLLVQEKDRGQPWYLPAGRVDPGERLRQAAVRETLEESGVAVRLEGILRVEHTPRAHDSRLRVVFVGHPRDDREPRATPDDETLGARYFTLDEIAELPLRGQEVLSYCRYLESGGHVAPLRWIGSEDQLLPGGRC